MLLLLPAVVLIIPTFQVEGFYFSFENPDVTCVNIIEKAGGLLCKFQGHNGFLYSTGCDIGCSDNHRLSLPEEICNEDAKEKLNKWKDDLEKRKEGLINEWCSYCKGK
ncbi:uncharacterized protein LOC115318686 isoform X2 [Ixodes scapularis]|uniref:uncharacterized protein LOC115318686 isoform X2 n=1 Tax=Ixodes scapularis TaxID=6945 RepID=UPI001A9E66F1|nr:uncharacterized protein LOC115318686 isoform X2 [Ixodes scapularis]